MNPNRKYIAITFIMIFFILVFLALISPVFSVKEIQVLGNSQLSNSAIYELGGIDGPGGNIFAFNSSSVRRKLLESNYIRSVRIKKSLPSTIVINIEERKVRGYVPYMGRYLYIDMDGRVIDVKETMDAPHPIVVGLKFDGFSTGEVINVTNGYSLDYVVQISKLIDAYDLDNRIFKLDVSRPEDIHLYVDKIDVMCGTIDDIYTKIATLNEVLKQLDTNEAGTLDISDTSNNPSFKLKT